MELPGETFTLTDCDRNFGQDETENLLFNSEDKAGAFDRGDACGIQTSNRSLLDELRGEAVEAVEAFESAEAVAAAGDDEVKGIRKIL